MRYVIPPIILDTCMVWLDSHTSLTINFPSPSIYFLCSFPIQPITGMLVLCKFYICANTLLCDRRVFGLY